MSTLKKNKSIKLKKKTTPKTTKTTQRIASSSNGAKKLEDYKQTKPKQLELFELTSPRQKPYSNTIEFYDAIPKYYWGKHGEVQDLKILKRTFVHRGIGYKVSISPAIIEDKNGNFKTYFPAKREELIEDVLRKMVCDGDGIFLGKNDEQPSASVVFTLYQIQQELKRQNHTHSINQIKEAIMVCGQSNIKLETNDGKSLLISNFFETVGLQTQEDWKGHGKKTRGFIRFNSLVTKSFLEKTFRLINYDKSMSYKKVLARWLHKRISHNYTQASPVDHYKINLSTIIRDSGVKQQKQLRGNLRDVKSALDEMCEKEVLKCYEVSNVLERRKLIDAKFTLFSHNSFVGEMKYSNKRYRDMREIENNQYNQQKIREIKMILNKK